MRNTVPTGCAMDAGGGVSALTTAITKSVATRQNVARSHLMAANANAQPPAKPVGCSVSLSGPSFPAGLCAPMKRMFYCGR